MAEVTRTNEQIINDALEGKYGEDVRQSIAAPFAAAVGHALDQATGGAADTRSNEQILNAAGAYCGECDYETGPWSPENPDGCSQCTDTLRSYVAALSAAGRLVTPEHDAQVLRDAADAWEGWANSEHAPHTAQRFLRDRAAAIMFSAVHGG